jgi:hypothetical protein
MLVHKIIKLMKYYMKRIIINHYNARNLYDPNNYIGREE